MIGNELFCVFVVLLVYNPGHVIEFWPREVQYYLFNYKTDQNILHRTNKKKSVKGRIKRHVILSTPSAISAADNRQ